MPEWTNEADLLEEEIGEVEQTVLPPRRRGRVPRAVKPAMKQDLVDFLAIDLDCSKADALKIVDGVARAIVKLTGSHTKLKIPKVGEFRVLPVQSRPGRNPKTGEPVPISAGFRVSFRASQPFKDLINGLVPKRFT